MIKENTNRAIAVNSIILYVRLAITSICGIFTTRFAFQALGVNDFGLFSVVGGIISFIAIINTIMVSTSNRFIATAIGKGDLDGTNKQFNVNLVIHCAIAIIVLIVAFPIGKWYILNYVNYSGDIDTVIWIFNMTIVGSVISFVGVPYNGLLMAKERFFVFCLTDIVAYIAKMTVCYILVYHFAHKLIIYTYMNVSLAIIPTIVFFFYCKNKFPEIVKLRFVKEKQMYKDVLSFSIWVGYGALATVGKAQGAALIINMFFNTVMNTALGLANKVNHIVLMFAQNVSKSIAPQITKSYAAGHKQRSMRLVCLSSKISFLVVFFVSTPFLLEPDYMFDLWLGDVPPYVTIFSTLVIIDSLIGSLNAGIPELIFASGKIKNYQVIVNTFFLLSIVAAFFVLKTGVPAYYLQVTYIAFSVIVLIVRQIVLNVIVKFDNKQLLLKSYLPSLCIALLVVPFMIIKMPFHPILNIGIVMVYESFLLYFIGLSKNEKNKVISFVKSKIKRKK